MEPAQLEHLRDLAAASGLVSDPQTGDGIVYGRSRLPATGDEFTLNLDPEEEDGFTDPATLMASAARFLAMDAATWRAIIDAVAQEVEEAVGDVEVIDKTDLRDDLDIRSVVIFDEITLLSFAADRQFPDSWIRAQLAEDYEVEDISVDERDEVETVAFDTLDDLLDHVSSDNRG